MKRQNAFEIFKLLAYPMMVCYWHPEEGMNSSLNTYFDETADRFFDETANENLAIGAVFALGSGLAQMFTKLAQRHG
jgi:hypothetical protein